MAYWNSRGLRGQMLEEQINFTNELYLSKSIGLIQKIPTPITPIEVDNANHTISLAYFEKKSTVDYIGIIQGVSICFDAKETAGKSLPMQNIHEHQVEFMKNFTAQKGIAFLLVHFSAFQKYYYLPFEILLQFWEDMQAGKRKSIPFDAFSQGFEIQYKRGIIHYLEAVEKDLNKKSAAEKSL